MAATRRDLLIGLAGLAGTYVVLRAGVDALARGSLAFEPMARPTGFRRLALGDLSTGGFDPFVGVASDAPAAPLAEDRLCAVLFGAPPPGIVPVASFSDYACPFCRVLVPRLAALAAEAPDIRVTWHEWPILAPSSHAAAAAALAAGRQGAYPAFQARLHRTPFQPTEAYLRAVATDLGLDAERLLADMRGPAVARRIADSAAAARLLGGVGTPLTVIGRTVVEGAVDHGTLARIVEAERDAGPVPGC